MKKYLILIFAIISIAGGIIFISTTSYFEALGDSHTTAKGKFGIIIFFVGIACYILYTILFKISAKQYAKRKI